MFFIDTMVDLRIVIAVVVVVVIAVAVYAYRKSQPDPPTGKKYSDEVFGNCENDDDCSPGTCDKGKCVSTKLTTMMLASAASSAALKSGLTTLSDSLATIGKSADTIKSIVENNTGGEFRNRDWVTPVSTVCDNTTKAVAAASKLVTGLIDNSATMFANAATFTGNSLLGSLGTNSYKNDVDSMSRDAADVTAALADVATAVSAMHREMASASRCPQYTSGQACSSSDKAAATIAALKFNTLVAAAVGDADAMAAYYTP